MLVAYENAVQQLIQLVPSGLIPTATLDSYINTARMQLAADAECIRAPAVLALVIGQNAYPITALTGFVSDTQSVITVRTASLNGAPLDFRSFEWFSAYYLGAATSGSPVRLAQQGQGAAMTLYFSPPPDEVQTVLFDAAWLPVPLISDATPEAIPYPWTDAVPFYAAWLAMMQLQRQADAHIMLTRYQELALRGRQETTPTVLPDNMPGGPGAHSAALKTTLTTVPQSAGGRGP